MQYSFSDLLLFKLTKPDCSKYLCGMWGEHLNSTVPFRNDYRLWGCVISKLQRVGFWATCRGSHRRCKNESMRPGRMRRSRPSFWGCCRREFSKTTWYTVVRQWEKQTTNDIKWLWSEEKQIVDKWKMGPCAASFPIWWWVNQSGLPKTATASTTGLTEASIEKRLETLRSDRERWDAEVGGGKLGCHRFLSLEVGVWFEAMWRVHVHFRTSKWSKPGNVTSMPPSSQLLVSSVVSGVKIWHIGQAANCLS